jgi:3'(2'), 5'-bisphosphate nucleotidase
MDDHRFARFAAEAVGIRLLQVRAQFTGSDPAGLGAAGDREAQALIAQLLCEHRPGDAVLSEEALTRALYPADDDQSPVFRQPC